MTARTPDALLADLESSIARHIGDPKLGRQIAKTIVKAELLLTLAWEYGNPHRADKANLLLLNYRLLHPDSFDACGHILQMARRKLMSIASSRSWEDTLARYMDDSTKGYRMFDITPDYKIIPRDNPFGSIDRVAAYKSWLLQPGGHREPVAQAKPGCAYTYWLDFESNEAGDHLLRDKVPQRGPRGVVIDASIPNRENATASTPTTPDAHKGTRPIIEFELAELIDVAHEAGELTGKDHLATVLECIANKGLFQRLEAGKAIPTQRIAIDRVTNLVGIVGAGKSVLANVLILACARRGLRVVTVLNSISEIMDSLEFFDRMGVSASPLASRKHRLNHLNALVSKKGGMLLDDVHARYFETPCLLDGMAEDGDPPVSYGSTPCFNLTHKKQAHYACPFYEICPSQAMSREARTSQVVITTPAGFSMIAIGDARQPFFEHVLADFDLVIFDEADRVQSQLDSQFSPTVNFQEIIRASADPTASAMKRTPEEKLIDNDDERFYDLRADTDPIAKALVASARKPAIAEWQALKNRAFTSISLYNLLQEEGLPDTLLKDLDKRIRLHGKSDPTDQRVTTIHLGDVIADACDGIDDTLFQEKLDRYIARMGVTLDAIQRDRLAFALKVVRFDTFLHKLEHASDMRAVEDDSIAGLYNFLHASRRRQISYLPASPVGNMFGFMITETNDVVLYRQFGIGRVFMTSLPWLDTDENGESTGPHALLLSGSSYEPGCLQFHLNQPVDYLLNAPDEVAEFLDRSKVRDLGLDIFVSGAGKKRAQNLNDVLGAMIDTLISELDDPHAHKVLVIVNSYKETLLARNVLEARLHQRKRSEGVCALVESNDAEDETALPRSEVDRFAQHPARILVAPALAVERGFNIVDESGHSAIDTLFFAVRPMGIPNDLVVRFKRMVGLICGDIPSLADNSNEFEQGVRNAAWRHWMALERDEALRLSSHASLDDPLGRDITATLMVLVVQIFDRLARVRDTSRRPPHIYFADAAFAGSRDPSVQGFHTLEMLEGYMRKLIIESEQPAVAQALYGPFHTALQKGMNA